MEIYGNGIKLRINLQKKVLFVNFLNKRRNSILSESMFIGTHCLITKKKISIAIVDHDRYGRPALLGAEVLFLLLKQEGF